MSTCADVSFFFSSPFLFSSLVGPYDHSLLTQIQIVERKIRLNDAANAAPADSGEPPTEGDAGAGATPEKEELAQWQAYLGTLQKALSTFRNDELAVDFANTEDGGACANLKTVMELPAKDTLNVRGTYNLICNLVDEEPVSVIDLCGASLAMSPADDKENAAKEAAATAAATAAAEAAGSAE